MFFALLKTADPNKQIAWLSFQWTTLNLTDANASKLLGWKVRRNRRRWRERWNCLSRSGSNRARRLSAMPTSFQERPLWHLRPGLSAPARAGWRDMLSDERAARRQYYYEATQGFPLDIELLHRGNFLLRSPPSVPGSRDVSEVFKYLNVSPLRHMNILFE